MKKSLSRLPISRNRASSTSRSSSSQLNTPSLIRSKSSLSLKRTPQSVQSCKSDRSRPKKKEVRPIQDKKWQGTMLGRTQQYFQKSAEGRQLLNKGISIRPITLNMFVQLTNIVLINIDSSFDELTLSNYTELLPIHLDTLMYPGVVTASTLKTANTMHSWPHILGILAWLVELHELSMMVSVEQTILEIPPNAPLDDQIKKSQLAIFLDSFQQWNNGKDIENHNEIIENMYRKFYNYSEDDYSHYSKKLEKVQRDLEDAEEALANDQHTLLALQNEFNTTENKLKNLNTAIDVEKQLRIDVCSKISEFSSETDNIKRAIHKSDTTIEKLKSTIKSQPMNMIDRTEIENEIEDLKRQVELINEKKAHELRLRDEKDMDLSEIKREIEQVVHDYNIELMRPALQHPELNQIALRQDKLLHTNMKQFIKENAEMKEKLINDLEPKIHSMHQTVSTLKQTQENKQKKIHSIKENIEEKKMKQETLTQQFETIVKNHEQIEKENEKKIIELKEKLLKVKEVLPTTELKLQQLKGAKTRCDELKNKLDTKASNMEKFFEQILDEIRVKQVPRYEKIRKTIVEKVDNAVIQYYITPSMLDK